MKQPKQKIETFTSTSSSNGQMDLELEPEIKVEPHLAERVAELEKSGMSKGAALRFARQEEDSKETVKTNRRW